MYYCAIIFLALTVFSQTLAPRAWAEARHALVIGNNAYEQVQPLQKAVNDAKAIDATLSQMGFNVITATDVGRRDMNRAIQSFVSGIEPGDIAMLFYAGHGIEIGGQNFLLPTDIPHAGPGQEGFVQGEAIALNTILDQITARKARLNVVILDACRDNPFESKNGRSLGATRGLAQINAPTGTFVMYSADAGEAALDRLSGNDPDPNSVFTRTLIPLMKTPGMDLVRIARETRRKVRTLAQTSRHQQTPAYYDAVLGEFYFTKPGATQVVATPAPTPTVGIEAAYAAASSINTEASWTYFLNEFEDQGGFYVALAQEALKKLSPKSQRFDLATLAPKRTWPNELTVVSWGGLYSQSQQKAYHAPYTREFGVKIQEEAKSTEAVQQLRKMHASGNVTWDLVDVVTADSATLCDAGIAMKIDPDSMLAPAPDGTSASRDFAPFLVNECFIPQIVWSLTAAYNKNLVGSTPPTKICDLFDLKTYPGKRALERRPNSTLIWALYCDGVPNAQVLPMLKTDQGVKRALAKLDTIKSDIVWWSAGAEAPQMLLDGEVVMGSSYNGRLFNNANRKDWPIEVLWDGQILDADGWIIPDRLSDARKARALEYVYFATDTKRLADQAQYIAYGPARDSSARQVGKHIDLGIDMSKNIPTNPAHMQNFFLKDTEFWNSNWDRLSTAFSNWLSK